MRIYYANILPINGFMKIAYRESPNIIMDYYVDESLIFKQKYKGIPIYKDHINREVFGSILEAYYALNNKIGIHELVVKIQDRRMDPNETLYPSVELDGTTLTGLAVGIYEPLYERARTFTEEEFKSTYTIIYTLGENIMKKVANLTQMERRELTLTEVKDYILKNDIPPSKIYGDYINIDFTEDGIVIQTSDYLLKEKFSEKLSSFNKKLQEQKTNFDDILSKFKEVSNQLAQYKKKEVKDVIREKIQKQELDPSLKQKVLLLDNVLESVVESSYDYSKNNIDEVTQKFFDTAKSIVEKFENMQKESSNKDQKNSPTKIKWD